MYLTKTPKFIQNLFPTFTWRIEDIQKKIYLTFDDGPIPEVTPWVLDMLDNYQAKATFFCVGDNVRKHREVFEEVISRGHSIGNHTYHHISGWQTDNIPYFHDVRKCARLVKSKLFRPPYGRIKPKQAQFLSRHYKIIMWDVLSGDFDESLSAQDCYQKVIHSTKNGSIIVFHDSLKSEEKLRIVLPKVLEYFSKLNYRFSALSESNIEKNYLEKAN